MSGTAGDHTPTELAQREQDIGAENTRAAPDSLPGMRGALARDTRSVTGVGTHDAQGDEHRDPPAGTPQAPPEPGDSPKVKSVRDPADAVVTEGQ